MGFALLNPSYGLQNFLKHSLPAAFAAKEAQSIATISANGLI